MHDKNTIVFFFVIILKEQTMRYSYKGNIQQESWLFYTDYASRVTSVKSFRSKEQMFYPSFSQTN